MFNVPRIVLVLVLVLVLDVKGVADWSDGVLEYWDDEAVAFCLE